MSYEPGSADCRLLIEAKESLENALRCLSGQPKSDHIQRQLLVVYSQLEGMHDLKRAEADKVSFTSDNFSPPTPSSKSK